MTEQSVLVTGACGEIGQALVQGLKARNGYRIVTADLAPLPDAIWGMLWNEKTIPGVDAETLRQ